MSNINDMVCVENLLLGLLDQYRALNSYFLVAILVGQTLTLSVDSSFFFSVENLVLRFLHFGIRLRFRWSPRKNWQLRTRRISQSRKYQHHVFPGSSSCTYMEISRYLLKEKIRNFRPN